MKKYPLQGLLSIREFREEAARTGVQAAERGVRAALDKEAGRRRALEDWQLWLPEEVERRYQGIMGRELTRKALDDFQAGLAELENHRLALLEDLRQAEKETAEASQALNQAREALVQATRSTQKIDPHREQWQAGENREMERAEDLELEEFKTPVSNFENEG